jgi:predicted nucleic acid-binding protein
MTYLVDTSIWISHFRTNHAYLRELLEADEVITHEFIIGELACGNLHNRKNIIQYLNDLPQVKKATSQEVLYLIDSQKLMGLGLGIVDFHLLTCAKIAQIKIFTADKKLYQAANLLNIAHHPH